MDIDTDAVVTAYLNIRLAREELLRKFEAEDQVLKADMDEVKSILLSVCNEVNADTIRTQSGTVMRSVKTRFYAADWEEFKKFVLEHQALDLFERRIHQSNFKTFMESHDTEVLPPGVNAMREYEISVRKPTSK